MGAKLAGVLLAVLGCLLLAGPASAARPSDELIAFASDRDGDSDIYTMRGDGTDVRQILDEPGDDWLPTWSPDGKQIAFLTNRHVDPGMPPLLPADDNIEIYVMNADGTDQRRLTNNTAEDDLMTWSPDGSSIAFESERDEPTGIYVMSADGSGVRRISPADAFDVVPAWSPDGSTILFATFQSNSYDIYSMDPEGGNRTPILASTAHEGVPFWAPDGTGFAFDGDTAEKGNFDISTIAIGSSTPTRLTDHNGFDALPRWSPHGERIAFFSTRDGGEDVYVMNADGYDQKRLTPLASSDADPMYKPMPRAAAAFGIRGPVRCGDTDCRARLRGRLEPPVGAHRPSACAGDVRVAIRARGRRLRRETTSLDADCRYDTTLRFARTKLLGADEVKARARFAGNFVVAPARASRKLAVRD